MRKVWLSLALVGLSSCDSNKTYNCTSPAMASLADSNTVAVIVDPGPTEAPQRYTNGIFASITLCVPGTTTCQTIDHLLVDTGSMGVRVLESLLTSLPLPAATTDAGVPLAECTPFVDGTAWGPVKMADVKVGQEVASNIPIQAIGDELTFTQVPTSCSGTPINNLKDLGSNGILGVGVYKEDCGAACARATQNPGLYYACSSQVSCSTTAVPVAKQVPNPVTAFPLDNNGVILQLPCVPPGGLQSVPGVMVFGIGTQTNNGLGTAKPLALDASGFVSTAFPEGGTKYTSFLDSGSNALFFLDAKTSGVKQCTVTGLSDFYCPSSTSTLTAEIFGSTGESASVLFNVANASTLPNPSNAFSDLAGPMPGFPTNTSIPGFDWGLPFYFGRSVYTAIEEQPTPGGVGPYFAF
jgi:hypothetical protein